MRLHYYKDPHGNFGDDLNPWLWSMLIPDLLDDDGRTLFVGIGTILRREIPRGPGKVVFGSGAGYGKPPVLDERWRVYCVRGPHTAAALGLEPGAAITDPAVLVRCLLEPVAPGERSGTAFIPHHESVHRAAAQGIDLEAVARSAGLIFIDPRGPVESVMESIRVARCVLTEAMHGAILADAWRVPWRAVRLYSHVLGSKWVDWTASLQLHYVPIELESRLFDSGELARFLRLASVEESERWELSEEHVLNAALTRLMRALDALRTDCHNGRVFVGQAADESPAADRHAAFPGPADSWWHAVATALREIAAATPADMPVAIAEGGQWSFDDPLVAARVVLLPSLTTTYGGPPADDHAACAMLTRALDAGIRHVAIGWPAFWWLETYRSLGDTLTREWRCTHASVWCRVYEHAPARRS